MYIISQNWEALSSQEFVANNTQLMDADYEDDDVTVDGSALGGCDVCAIAFLSSNDDAGFCDGCRTTSGTDKSLCHKCCNQESHVPMCFDCMPRGEVCNLEIVSEDAFVSSSQSSNASSNDDVCEICSHFSVEDVRVSTGENGVEMRVCIACDKHGDTYNGWGNSEEPNKKKVKNDKFICDMCEEYDETEVGIATGYNGVEAKVCKFCDLSGSNYNEWGGNLEDYEEDEDGGYKRKNI